MYNTSDMNTVGATFQNELILPVDFSTIALFMARLSGLPIIYIEIGDVFQNELILPVGFSTIALFMARLSGLPIIYIEIGDVVGGNNNMFELLL